MAFSLDKFFKIDLQEETKETKASAYKEKLSLKAGNKYLVRILPYLKEGRDEVINKTKFHFYNYAWKSVVDGRWVYCLSPRTYGESYCPMSSFYYKAMESDNEKLKARIKDTLSYREGWYFNVYVIDDPTNPKNNGTVKILPAGKQLYNVIKDALDPEHAADNEEEFGCDLRKAIFDLSPNGINLCIDVQEQAGFANYKSSAFIRRQRDLGLTSDEIKTIYDSVFDLTQIDQRRSLEETEKLFQETFLGVNSSKSSTRQSPPKKQPQYEDDDEAQLPDYSSNTGKNTKKSQTVLIDDIDSLDDIEAALNAVENEL